MSANKRVKNKSIDKDDLKFLMKMKRNEISSKRKVDSPLARYDKLGRLLCIVCNCPVKSEIVWKVHVQSKSHKQALEDFRNNEEQPVEKKQKLKEKEYDAAENAAAETTAEIGNSSTLDVEDKLEKGALPADFFDSSIVVPSIINTSENPEENNDKKLDVELLKMSEKLPEGFFDDPKTDAKVREIEYKDKMEAEWDDFQKVLKEETHISDQIKQEDVEDAQEDRTIQEIDEQIHRWSKVEELHEKKEKLTVLPEVNVQNQSSLSEDENLEYEDFLDWRKKNVW